MDEDNKKNGKLIIRKRYFTPFLFRLVQILLLQK
jgi:hypothetical protein